MSSLDRAFFRAYAKEQPVTPDIDRAPTVSETSPYVHAQSSRQPQLRYRIEPTHAPWGAAAPGDAESIETPDIGDEYHLADADDSFPATAWSSEGEAHLAVSQEPAAADVVARSMHTPDVKFALSDAYAEGIVCLPGMGVPEFNYLATLVTEETTEGAEVDSTAIPAHSPVEAAEPEPSLAAESSAAYPPPAESIEPPTAASPEQPEVLAEPTSPADRASLLADETAAFWEVDRYLYPAISDRLLNRYEYFAHSGEKLKQAAQAGLKVLGITGVGRDEGRSTLAICLARAAARSGLKVALMDCDFQHPRLAQGVGLDVAAGWESVVRGETALAEVAIRSLEDGVMLLPLLDEAQTSTLSMDDESVQQILAQVRQSSDVVILDAGPIDTPSGRSSLDAAIVVWDRRRRKLEEAETVAQRLSAAGVEAVGIAENFAG